MKIVLPAPCYCMGGWYAIVCCPSVRLVWRWCHCTMII